MPRHVKDSKLHTREARLRLPVSIKPYYRMVAPGLHIGYRRRANGSGTWVVRRRIDDRKYVVENLRTPDGQLVIADDFDHADGGVVLTFAMAQDRAKTDQRLAPEHKSAGAYTVADAMADYIAEREASRRPTADAISHNRAFIAPELGSLKCAKLTTTRLKTWLRDLAKAQPRLRTRTSDRQQYREVDVNDDEAARRRRATANRVFTTLRAALNKAWRDEKIELDSAWHKVKPFEDVDAPRVRYLTIAEAKRLINATTPDFRKIVRGALMTGARYGALARLTTQDFNPDAGTITLRSRKGRGKQKSFHVVLSAEGVRYFGELCAGLGPNDLIFRKANGEPWGKSQQKRLMDDACHAAKIKPAIGIHGLRHTYASHAVMNGVPLFIVAKNLGHSDTRMVEKHYGHVSPSFHAEQIRKGAPQFGTRPGKVRPLMQQ